MTNPRAAGSREQVRLNQAHTEAIRRALEAAGVSYRELARRLGCSQEDVRKYLRTTGRKPWPADQFEALGPILGKPPLWPLWDVHQIAPPRSVAERVDRYFRTHQDVPHGLVLAVRSLAASPELWSDDVLEALRAASERLVPSAPTPRSKKRGDEQPGSAR